MKFLLDVNVGSTIAFALQAAGHDVVRTVFLAPRALDPQILAWAVAEQRVLVTYDSDFTDLIFRDLEPQPPAVIYVRDEPDRSDEFSSKDRCDGWKRVPAGPYPRHWRSRNSPSKISG